MSRMWMAGREMNTEFVFFLLIVIAILLSIILRIMVNSIEKEMKDLYYQIDRINCRLDILERKIKGKKK